MRTENLGVLRSVALAAINRMEGFTPHSRTYHNVTLSQPDQDWIRVNLILGARVGGENVESDGRKEMGS